MISLLKERDRDIVNGISKYQHSLQAAHLADEDGADDETIVCALLHDVMGGICPDNHARAVAELLKPYISRLNYLILFHHDDLQKDNWKGRPHGRRSTVWYEYACDFVDKYDYPAFEKNKEVHPDKYFEMLRRMIA